MDLNLRDKVALVTGGGSGIGRGVCTCLAEEGVDVAVNYIVDEHHVKRFVERLNATYGTHCTAIYGDVSKSADVDTIIEAVVQAHGRIDFLVNNAGVWPTEELVDTGDASWRQVLDVNLTGPFMLAKRVAQHLLSRQGSGRIVNISSNSGFRYTTPGHGHYAVSKAGLNMLTAVLARELSGQGITAVGVAPGVVETPLNEDKRSDPELRAYYESRIPIGRFARPAEIGYLVAFLLSDKAANINGTVVDCSGGMLI